MGLTFYVNLCAFGKCFTINQKLDFDFFVVTSFCIAGDDKQIFYTKSCFFFSKCICKIPIYPIIRYKLFFTVFFFIHKKFLSLKFRGKISRKLVMDRLRPQNGFQLFQRFIFKKACGCNKCI